MYEPHDLFIKPQDQNAKIWRYLDFTKFVSLIDSQELFFTRADRFDDPFEGSFSELDLANRRAIGSQLRDIKSYEEHLSRYSKSWRKFVAINCWHQNEYESAAMWKLYLKSDEGIAIQSTFSRLKGSFINEDEVNVGTVKYIDYDSEAVGITNVFSPFLHKRRSFEHEREIRAIVAKWPYHQTDIYNLDISQEPIQNGLPIKVDIETLIERIYVAPNSAAWFTDLIRSIARKYGYTFPVLQSNMNKNPLF